MLSIPIGHGDGNYFADPETLKRLERRRIALRFAITERIRTDRWRTSRGFSMKDGMFSG